MKTHSPKIIVKLGSQFTGGVSKGSLAPVACALAFVLTSRSMAQTSPPVLWSYDPINTAYCEAFSPDGAKLIIAGDQGVQIFNASTEKVISCVPTIYPIVDAIAISPDGKTLAIGGNNLSGGSGSVELWNLSTLKLERTLATSALYINSLAFSPDSKTVAEGGQVSQGSGLPVQIFDVATGKALLAPYVPASTVASLQFAADGKSIAIGGEGSSGVAEIVSSSTGAVLQSFKTATAVVNSVAISPNGVSLIVGGTKPDPTTLTSTGYLEVWNTSTAQLTSSLNTACQSVNSVQFSPDGKSLVDGVNPTLTADGAIQLWNTTSWKLVDSFNDAALNGVLAVKFSPNGKTIVELEGLSSPINGNSRSAVNIWSTSSHTLAASLNLSVYGPTSSTAFSADGKTLLSGSGGFNPTGSADIYFGLLQFSDALTGSILKTVKTSNFLSSIAISPSGAMLAACGQNGTSSTLELRNPTSGSLVSTLNTLTNDQYALVTFSRDGSLIAASRSVGTGNSTYQNVEIWNVAKRKLVETLDTEMGVQVNGMSFSPDDSTLAVGGTGYSNDTPTGDMQLWNVSKGTLITPLYPSLFNINAVQYSPDGSRIAIGGITYNSKTGLDNGSVEIWNTASESSMFVLAMPSNSQSVTGLAYSKDGNVIYAASKIGVQAFETANGLILESDLVGALAGLAVSPNGTLISYSSYQPLIGVLQSPITSIKLLSSTIVGGLSTTGTITLATPAPTGGTAVSLFSDITTATFPSKVVVPAGKSTVSFKVTTTAVATQQVAAISAFVGGYSQSANLTIQGPSLTAFTLTPASVKGGAASSGTISINNPAPTGGIVVYVSSNSTSAIVPETVTIPVGKTSATFSIGTGPVKTKTSVGISIRLGTTTETKILTLS